MAIRLRTASPAATALLTAALTAAAAPAAARPIPSGSPGPPDRAGATHLVFDKNQRDPADSRVRLVESGTGRVLADYRAGSGQGGTAGRDECAKNKGWLPDGTYRVLSHTTRKKGGRDGINGYAVHVADKVCRDGRTRRTELFLHSEMRSDGTQGVAVPGRDSPYRWDGDGDYRSRGCVKLAPADLKHLFAAAQRYGWPTMLKVVK
ncbi:L,D-transpeptidase family protein [Streptomyces sp. NPDC018019]|uniref:L,D-transpeptidase family protein n=1 Tax=Streptomyces sp. NPDC018019 TaxID=3365030 RepID=UPI00378B289C